MLTLISVLGNGYEGWRKTDRYSFLPKSEQKDTISFQHQENADERMFWFIAVPVWIGTLIKKYVGCFGHDKLP